MTDVTLGHNRPPEEIELLRDKLAETHRPLIDRGQELVDMKDRLPASCDDEDTAARLADAVKACTAYTKNADAARVSAKEPFLASGRAVDGFFKALSDPVDRVKQAAGALLTAYQRRVADEERRRREAIAAEERRLAREAEQKAREAKKAGDEAEAKRLRDEAQAQRALAQVAREEAQVKAAELTRNRSTIGSVASLRTTWAFEVVNPDLVPRLYMRPDEGAIRAAIKANTDSDGRCKLKIDGVKIFEKQESVVR
jgi:uncharacterized protein YhaN